MASTIERVNYYERQYLRSFDFSAEQNYHLEMRRRLNLTLHLTGLVQGLEVDKGPLAAGLPDQVYVTPGVAIDGYGREIVRFSTFAIDEDVLADNKVTQPGVYGVYAAYKRDLATPPDAGYRVCNLADQYTRWLETGRIFLSNEKQPQPAVGPTDALPDDPDAAPWPVRLGTVVVSLVGGELVATDVNPPKPGERNYAGIRAQRLVAPAASLAAKANETEKVLPISSESDFRAAKNLIVGTDFQVDKHKVQPPLPPPPAPPAPDPGDAGNIRVENNLFLKGDLFKSKGDQWLSLSNLFQQMIPEIQVHNGIEIDTSTGIADPLNGTFDLDASLLTSKVLTKPSGVSVFAALAGFQLQSKNNLNKWWTDLNNPADAAAIQVGVTVAGLQKKAGSDNVFEGSLAWSVGPKSTPANPPDAKIIATKLFVNVIVVFSP